MQHGGAHLQPVHLFPILMATSAGGSARSSLLFVAVDLAAAGREPRRRGRRRSRRREPRARRISPPRPLAVVGDCRSRPAFAAGSTIISAFRVAARALVRREPAVRARRVAVGGGRARPATAGSFTATTRRSRTTRTREPMTDAAIANWRSRIVARARLAARAAASPTSSPSRPTSTSSIGEEMPSTLARLGDAVARRSAVHGTAATAALAVDVRPALVRGEAARAHLPADRHALERSRRVRRLPADHRRGPRTRAGDAAGVDARGFDVRSIARSKDSISRG